MRQDSLGRLVHVAREQKLAAGFLFDVLLEIFADHAASRDARRRRERREDSRSHGVEPDGDGFFAHGLGRGRGDGQLRKIAAHSALGDQGHAHRKNARIVDAASHVQNRRNSHRRADFLQPRPGVFQRRLRPQQAKLGARDGAASGLHHQHVLRQQAADQGQVVGILRHARIVAPYHAHNAADTARRHGVDERPVPRAETAAQVVRQVLVGETGHQVHLVARNVHARRIAPRERLDGALHNGPRGRLGVMGIERHALRTGDVGLGGGGYYLGVTTRGHLGQGRHDALHVHHHQVHGARQQGQFLVQIVARHRHALAHQDLIGGATNAGDVDALGARLPRQCEQVRVPAGGHDHLAQNRFVAVHQNVDLAFLEHSQVGLRPNCLRPAEEHVLHVGGDHRPAPAVGQRGAHGPSQQGHRVRFHAVVRAMKQLDDLAVDSPRRDAHLLPSPALLLGSAQRRDERPFLGAKLGRHAVRQRALVRRHSPFRRQRLQLLRVGDDGRVAQNFHHLAPVVAVRRGADGHRPSQVAGHNQVGIGAAGSHL